MHYKKSSDSVDYETNDPFICTEPPIIPNVITSKGDGVNDLFKINCKDSYIIPTDLIIYNRWGQEVYSTAKKDNFNKVVDGTYFYIFSYD